MRDKWNQFSLVIAACTALMVVLLVATLSTAVAQTWYFESEIDPFTDTQTAFSYIGQTEGEPAWLVIRCRENTLEVFVSYSHKIVVTDVRTRIGKEQPTIQDWGSSTTDDAVYHPSASSFLTNLRSAEQQTLAIQVWDEEGKYYVSVLHYSGINEEIEPLRKAGCSRDIIERVRN